MPRRRIREERGGERRRGRKLGASRWRTAGERNADPAIGGGGRVDQGYVRCDVGPAQEAKCSSAYFWLHRRIEVNG